MPTDAQKERARAGPRSELHGRLLQDRPRQITEPFGRPDRDYLRFLRAWFTRPVQMGAVAPSSFALAEIATAEIGPDCAPVLELGPGTGVFTRALIRRGVVEDSLVLAEFDAGFAQLLETRFSKARVLCTDAARLPPDVASVGAVISALPLSSMPLRQVYAILTAAFHRLPAKGAFYQVTYRRNCPVPRRLLDRLGLKATRIGGTMRNIPPASVYRIICRGRIVPLRHSEACSVLRAK